jgi:hypothetical protein
MLSIVNAEWPYLFSHCTAIRKCLVNCRQLFSKYLHCVALYTPISSLHQPPPLIAAGTRRPSASEQLWPRNGVCLSCINIICDAGVCRSVCSWERHLGSWACACSTTRDLNLVTGWIPLCSRILSSSVKGDDHDAQYTSPLLGKMGWYKCTHFRLSSTGCRPKRSKSRHGQIQPP